MSPSRPFRSPRPTFRATIATGLVCSQLLFAAACGRSGLTEGFSVSPEFSRRNIAEPTQPLVPMRSNQTLETPTYDLVDARMTADLRSKTISVQISVRSSAGLEVVPLAGTLREDGTATLQDLAPITNGRQRLIAEAACRDLEKCEELILNVYFKVGSQQMRRQFVTANLAVVDTPKAPTSTASPVPGQAGTGAPPAALDENELPEERDDDPEIYGQKGEYVGPRRNHALIEELWARPEKAELPETSMPLPPPPPPVPDVVPEPNSQVGSVPLPAPAPAPSPSASPEAGVDPAPPTDPTRPSEDQLAPLPPLQPQQPAPAPQQQPAPVPQQPAPAPQQPAPAPQQPAPVPQQPAPVLQQPAPAPQQPAPRPQQPTSPSQPPSTAPGSNEPMIAPSVPEAPPRNEQDARVYQYERRLAPLLNLRGGGIARGYFGESGRPAGSIVNSTKLQSETEHIDFAHPQRNTRWGTGMMISLIENSTKYTATNFFANDLKLSIGNISKEGGGVIPSASNPNRPAHASHQNGLDVDIPYPPNKSFVSVIDSQGRAKSNFDMRKTWQFLRVVAHQKIIDDGTGRPVTVLNRVFMGRNVKKALCEWAKREKLLDNPADVDIMRRIRETPNHDDHMHVRLKCSPYYRDCQDQQEVTSTFPVGCR